MKKLADLVPGDQIYILWRDQDNKYHVITDNPVWKVNSKSIYILRKVKDEIPVYSFIERPGNHNYIRFKRDNVVWASSETYKNEVYMTTDKKLVDRAMKQV